MAAFLGPRMTTASTCTLETARGKHVFKIAGHRMHTGLGVGKFIRSATFEVGGYQWRIRYYPDSDGREGSRDYVSVYLELVSKNAEVRVLFDVSLVDQATGLSSPVFSVKTPKLLNSRTHENPTWGRGKFMKRSQLEALPYLVHDSVVIVCDVTVIKQVQVVETVMTSEIQVPPSDLLDNLGKLLETDDEADVTFKVQGEVFHAHKIVLAMRSPVFKAELYGPMRDKRSRNITIQDMQPAVFKALLHYIYTDSLPPMDHLDDGDSKEMVKHLLVAADRYAMERMKLMCERILCKSLDVESVATTLALADQHHCNELKDVCVEFILSSNRIDDVLASQGYEHLKRACPAVFVDIWEKAAKSSKFYYAHPGLNTD